MAHTHDEGNAGVIASALFTSLTSDVTVPASPDLSGGDFTFDKGTNNPLYQDPQEITIKDVTCSDVDGHGAFDEMMKAVDKQLLKEFKGNRLTGDQYAKVYAEVMASVLGNATQFVLQKDQAKWQAIATQMQARKAEIEAVQTLVELEKVKAETAKMFFDMSNSGAQYALTKMQLATEDAKHCNLRVDEGIKEYQLKNTMPAEVAIQHYQRMAVLPAQVAISHVQADRVLPAEASLKEYTNRVLQPLESEIQKLQRDRVIPAQAGLSEFELASISPVRLAQEQHKLNHHMPAETALVKEQYETERANTISDNRSDNLTPIGGVIKTQKDNMQADIDTKVYSLANLLPVQVQVTERQRDLTQEQIETERAKTMDTRTDGTTVVEGSVGKQKDLYDQQIDSFIKDAKHKTAKMYLDGWITQKTIDEGTPPPAELNQTNINSVLNSVRTTNNL